MAKVLEATDYGYRKVIRVVTNPNDPESVHDDGSPHTGVPPAGTAPGLRAWEWCNDCRYNWNVQEFVWTGDELYTRDQAGSRRLKTNQELLDETSARLQPVATASQISELVDQTIGQ